MSNVKATARVQVTLEVTLSQPWGAECNFAVLQKAAKEDALMRIQKLSGSDVRIVGTPKVTAVLVEEPDR